MKEEKSGRPFKMFERLPGENPVSREEVEGEMPGWSALPEADRTRANTRDPLLEERDEIPGFPTSITLTWAYFPELFS